MGRKSQATAEEAQAIDLTPMLDVVFIMLIFFIVTASFVKETGKEVERPDAITSDAKKNATVLIAIGPENDIWIDKKEVDPRMVTQAIKRLRVDNPKGTVSIQADVKADIKFVISVANSAREAGITEISVSTEKM